MKVSTIVVALLLLAGVGAGGYWLGGRAQGMAGDVAQAGAPAGAASMAKAPAVRKLLYYRNPMGLADTSPVPKKDPMGMDYVAVFDGEDASPSEPGAAAQIRISTEKVQRLGVRVEAASMRVLERTLRASGRVEPDERRIYAISPKFEGYVERLHVNVTGQPVSRGQPLFEVYSPELVSAQREYAIAMQGVKAMKDASGEALGGMKQLADSSLARLGNWDFSPEQIEALVRSGEVRRTITFRSPVSGIVTEKKAVQGMRFMPGEALYQITDLSSVWVLADIFEQDLGLVKTGAKARVKINAYPNREFNGTITYIYPMLKAETRTVPVRIELANAGQLLKPAMLAQVELQIGSPKPVLTIPDSAVIDSGMRRIVLIQRKEGSFEPREVKIGAASENYVEVLDGVREGEQVVVTANFLIDAESNLKAATGGLGGHAGHGAAPGSAGSAAPATPPVSAPTLPSVSAPGAGAAPPQGVVGHKATGTVDGIDAKTGTVSLKHGAVASLKWPAMTMEFKVANPALLKDLTPGAPVAFEFVERGKGEWVITSIAPAASSPPATGHTGH